MAKSMKLIIEQDAGDIEAVVREMTVNEVFEVVDFLAAHVAEFDNLSVKQQGVIFKRYSTEIQEILANHSVVCPIPFAQLDFSDAMKLVDIWKGLNQRFLDEMKARIAETQAVMLAATASLGAVSPEVAPS